jgi:hypothetical protein
MSVKKKNGAGKAREELNRIDRILRGFPTAERQNLRRTFAQYKKGKCSKWIEQKLSAAGLITLGPTEGQSSPTVDGQVALADLLQLHFAGRIAFEITQPKICHWIKGRPYHGVANGSPPPPSRRGNRYVVQEWKDWVEQYVLPSNAVNGHASAGPREPTIFEKAQEAEAERQIIERNRARRNEEIELGNFIPIQEHIGRLKIIGQVLNQAITDSIEKTIVQTITDAAKVLPFDEQKMAEFRQQIQQACEAAADSQRTALAGAMLQATDKTP